MICTVNKLNKSYKNNKVLNNISFNIEHPQILALVGPNGSGKSTLMNCMMNLISFDSGEIKILDMDNRNPSIFKSVSYLKDNRILYPYLSGYDHLKYICDIQKLDYKNIAIVAEKVGIDNFYKKRVDTYSLGMKQRVLLAMSIINNPKLILMDEPLNGLDTDSIFSFRDLIKELHAKGTTILISSHTLSELDYITNDILFLKDGSIIYEDIEKYKQTECKILVNDKSQLKKLDNFLSSNYSLENYNNNLSTNELIIKLNAGEINKIIQVIYENNIEIERIISKTYGAEDRYKQIFDIN